MVGYLHSPKTGALTYNLVHNWAIGLIVLGAGLWSDSVPAGCRGLDPRRACRHGPRARLRPEAAVGLPGHPPRPDRQASGRGTGRQLVVQALEVPRAVDAIEIDEGQPAFADDLDIIAGDGLRATRPPRSRQRLQTSTGSRRPFQRMAVSVPAASISTSMSGCSRRRRVIPGPPGATSSAVRGVVPPGPPVPSGGCGPRRTSARDGPVARRAGRSVRPAARTAGAADRRPVPPRRVPATTGRPRPAAASAPGGRTGVVRWLRRPRWVRGTAARRPAPRACRPGRRRDPGPGAGWRG